MGAESDPDTKIKLTNPPPWMVVRAGFIGSVSGFTLWFLLPGCLQWLLSVGILVKPGSEFGLWILTALLYLPSAYGIALGPFTMGFVAGLTFGKFVYPTEKQDAYIAWCILAFTVLLAACYCLVAAQAVFSFALPELAVELAVLWVPISFCFARWGLMFGKALVERRRRKKYPNASF